MISGWYQAALLDPVTAGSPLEEVFETPGDLVVIGAEAVDLEANNILLGAPINFAARQQLVRIGVYLDGQGHGNANQVIRPVLYRNGTLVASGPPVEIIAGQPAGWVSLLPAMAGMTLEPGDYRAGVQAGPTRDGGRFYIDPGTGPYTLFAGVPFTSGPPAILPGGGIDTAGEDALFFIETHDPIVVRPNVSDAYVATLPFNTAQAVFTSKPTVKGSRVKAVAGWYGSKFSPLVNAHAVVRADGPLAGLLGRRALVTRPHPVKDRVVGVYVHDAVTFPPELVSEQILLSKRAFAQIGNHGLDELDVTVGILG